jgi:hypothetical protein
VKNHVCGCTRINALNAKSTKKTRDATTSDSAIASPVYGRKKAVTSAVGGGMEEIRRNYAQPMDEFAIDKIFKKNYYAMVSPRESTATPGCIKCILL